MKTSVKNHKHTWIVTTIATVSAVLLILLLPGQKAYSSLLFGFAGAHLVLALIAIFTGWILIPQRFINQFIKRRNINEFDFGWSPKWIYGFLVASVLTFVIAIHVYFSLTGSPIWQFIVYTFLLLLAVNFFIGNVIIANSNRTTQIILPMVDILANGGNKILDAGIGAGRTTIAIAKAFPKAEITAFDKFDADYIEEGGMNLLKQNLKLAGIENRVNIQTGDILKTPFEPNQFDAIVSSYMIDHLRKGKQQALSESFRILKPGGRFLLIIAVRGYSTFGIASFMSLFMTSRKTWKIWIEQAGFKMISDGKINEGAFFLFEKPSYSC